MEWQPVLSYARSVPVSDEWRPHPTCPNDPTAQFPEHRRLQAFVTAAAGGDGVPDAVACRLFDHRNAGTFGIADGAGSRPADALFRTGYRRLDRGNAARGECHGDALSRLADQDDDALPAVRGDGAGQGFQIEPDPGLIQCVAPAAKPAWVEEPARRSTWIRQSRRWQSSRATTRRWRWASFLAAAARNSSRGK